MQSSDSQILESFVPVYDTVPEKWEDARPFLVEQMKKITNAVNVREIGFFLDEELLSGKSFIPGVNANLNGATSQLFRQVLRKVIDFGGLPLNPLGGTKSVPHGIVFDANFTLVQMWASATDPIALTALPIPFASPSALAENIRLYMDRTFVNITTAANYSGYTRCFVVIEYMQEL
jgi:hypothetical protein